MEKVRKGEWNSTPVAVKLFAGIIGDEDFLQEVLIARYTFSLFNTRDVGISRLRHQNIVSLVGYILDSEDKCIVTQYYQHGSLFDIIHADPPVKQCTQKLIFKFAKDVSRGVLSTWATHALKLPHF